MSIDIANESGTGVDEHAIVDVARWTLDRMRIHPLAELSVVIVDEPAMEQLHIQWMDLPGPTDVMSFPMDELRPGKADEDPPQGLLGDVVLCPTVAQRQGAAAGHSMDDELHLLTVHGVLHLLGYDHAEPDEEREMFALQKELLESWREARRAAGDRG
ncbi:rRNA maturation RNase YbeY [Embleya sp. NPDC050154]|jgi:probable rRNA maturation factor|uniref:rRNA maturation RNase YbeY n=1 Tax=unclassified Embleya TaxID=2699296 RepID=UPI0033E892A1|nr:rRNA maturation RNase YbeY [Embleya sp. NBC_00896]WSY39333.1 rRNA maturation RNase YbeY [Embleya sp. NBC_00888]